MTTDQRQAPPNARRDSARFLQTRMLDFKIACPAGQPVGEAMQGGTSCLCRIEGQLLTARENPSSLALYCLSPQGYTACSSWRTDKEAAWASTSIDDFLAREK